MTEGKKKKSFFQSVVAFFKDVYEWVEETFGDPAVSAVILEDLGLDASGGHAISLPPDRKAAIEKYVKAQDPDKEAFLETVAAVQGIVEAITAFIDSVSEDGALVDEMYYRFVKLTAIESMRVRNPAAYTFSSMLGFIYEEFGGVQDFDLDRFLGLLNPDPLPVFKGGVPVDGFDEDPDRLVWFASDMMSAIPAVLELAFKVDRMESYYGWEPDPGSTTPIADLVSQRALTMIIGKEDAAARPSITVLMVPDAHGGFGFVVSMGGHLNLTHSTDTMTTTVKTDQTGALRAYLPTNGDGAQLAGPGLDGNSVAIEVTPNESQDLIIGNEEDTHISVGNFTVIGGLGPDGIHATLSIKDAALLVKLDEGDGFVTSLPGDDIRFGFDLSLHYDSDGGVTFGGGTGLKTTVPVNEAVFGALQMQFVELSVGPSTKPDYHVVLEVTGAFGLDIGPFAATVERLGFLFDLKFGQGNLGVLDVDFGFKPPHGIGLVLNASAVKGGGYLFFDDDRNEYAGILELAIGSVGLKAIGIISTQLPDGSSGWTLILMIFADFPAIQVGFGFSISGIGGVIGLHHGISIQAIQAGLRSGALDHVLFPDDPVANAPALLNSVRAIYPVTHRALVIGPMAQIEWGTPPVIRIKLGIVTQIDNVFHSNGASAEVTRVTLIGQLRAEMPAVEKRDGEKPLLQLVIDILGYFDFTEQKIGVDARLRDSKIASLTITGSFVLRSYAGSNPGFIMAAGGFHPNFEDIPPDVPKQDRLGLKIKHEKVSMTIAGYVALTSNTVQFGARIDLKVGPYAGFTLEGHLGFDALFVIEPFSFTAIIKAGVALKRGSSTLMSVSLAMTIEGPGRWHVFGKAKFKILFFSKTIDFDLEWGDRPPAVNLTASAVRAFELEAQRRDNWTAALPDGGEALVSLRMFDRGEKVLAHPLGSLSMRQTVVPLEMQLDRLGDRRIDGDSTVKITSLTIGGQTATHADSKEHFARAQFFDMTNAEKLKAKSFERFKAGVTVSTADVTIPASRITGNLDYETKYLKQERPNEFGYKVAIAQLRRGARFASTGRSRFRPPHEAVGASVTIAPSN